MQLKRYMNTYSRVLSKRRLEKKIKSKLASEASQENFE